MKDITEGAMERLDVVKQQAEGSLQSISDCANDAWNKVMDSEGVHSSLETIRQTADDAWEAGEPVLAKTGDAVAQGAKKTAYVGGRAALGVASVGEDVYIGVRSNAELATGNEEAAVHTAQSSVIDSAKETWDETMQSDEFTKKAGDIAEKVGNFVGDAALGTAAVTATGPVAVAAPTAVVALNEMGKSLRKSSSDGEITKDDVAKEAAAGTAAAGSVLVGRKLAEIGEIRLKKYKPNSEIDKNGVKYLTDDSGKIYREGNRLLTNRKYEINGYSYETDAKGRIVSASGNLHLKGSEEGRSPIRDSMPTIGRGDALETDHRGHLIGDVFDGGNGMENIIAMDGKVNQGAYKQLEIKWKKALESNSHVEVKIKPIYKDGSARPDQFAVLDIIDGKKTVTLLRNH